MRGLHGSEVRRNALRRARILIAGAAAVSLLAACSGGGGGDGTDETVTVKLSSPFPTTNAIGRLTDWWLENVGAELDGVEFDYYPAAQLLPLSDSLAGVLDGRVESAYIAESFATDQLPFWGATAIPFQTDNVEATVRSEAELYENDPRFRALFRDAGLEVLFFAPINAGVWALEEPIDSLDDMDGLRLRSSGRVAEAEKALGVEPIFMDPGEVYESISRGVVDGSSTFPLDNAVTFGLQEVAPNFVDSGYGIFTQGAVVISAEVFDSLPQSAQDAIAAARNGDAITQAYEIQSDSEAKGCDALLEAGGNIVKIDDDEVAEWRDSVFDTLVTTWKGQVTAKGYEPTDGRTVDEDLDDWLETWQSTVAANEATATYVPGLTDCVDRG